MDAYISQEAYRQFLILKNISQRPDIDGFLLGHKRAQRYFVEKILPTEKGFFSSIENYLEAEKNLEEELLGFFSFDYDKKKLEKILLPFAFGLLFLAVHSNQRKALTFKPYIIDFKKKFYLSSIKLKLPKKAK